MMYPDDIWEARFAAVDRAIQRSKTIWAIDYWTNVRSQLARKMHYEMGKRYL